MTLSKRPHPGRLAEEGLRLLPSDVRPMSASEEEELVEALAELLLERLEHAPGRLGSGPSGRLALLPGSGSKEER